MINALSVALSLDTHRECINELSKHGMNEKIILFGIFWPIFGCYFFSEMWNFAPLLNIGEWEM